MSDYDWPSDDGGITTPPETVVPPEIDNKISDIDKRVADLQKFQQQYTQQQQPQTQQPQLTPQEQQFMQYIQQQAYQAGKVAAAETSLDLLTQQYKQQHPELVPFEREIKGRAGELAAEAQRKGDVNPMSYYIDESIKEFNNKLQQFSGSTQSAKNTQLNAMRFDVGNPAPDRSSEILTADKLGQAMHDPKAYQAVRAEYYRSKGISP